MNRRVLFSGAVVLVAPLAGVACGGSSTKQATGSSAGATAITIRATDFAFAPNVVRVPVGKSVRLQMVNNGLIEHDVRVDQIPASDIRTSDGGDSHGHDSAHVVAHSVPGKSGWVEFTPTKTGTFDLTCTISGHREAGMKGTLIVE
jgi:uncharacterized cupredoxin-like copper-binding protein